jgi:hypothetical protein
MSKAVPFALCFIGTLCSALADGFVSMKLKEVLLDTKTIILVEIIENTQTIEHREARKGIPNSEVFIYKNEIKSNVLSTHLGEFEGRQYNTTFVQTLCKGVWARTPNSGLEGRMKPGERYVLLLSPPGFMHMEFMRAEEGGKLAEILQLRKEVEEEERRIAEAQARIPNGIYRFSVESGSQKVRTVEGFRGQIGQKLTPDIVGRKFKRLGKRITLRLTLGSKLPGNCFLMLDGKGYFLYYGYWDPPSRPPTARSPELRCNLRTPEEAKPLAAYFGVAVPEAKEPAGKQ